MMPDSYVLSVSQLNQYVASLLAVDPLLSNVSVEGEISGYKKYSSGHAYFALKDEAASVRCVFFKQHSLYLNFDPKDGMRVKINGTASIYAKDGQFQIIVAHMTSVGEGELYERFLLLKEKLERKGFFDISHKKALPLLPKTVGVVTSGDGAVFHDIQNVTKRRFPKMNILLSHSKVQGIDAPSDIAESIKRLDMSKKADVIIVARGGGSIEDLFAYNEEVVATAIYECVTPVVSAIGHETDYCIADFVADYRAPTPSAAAEIVVPLYSELSEKIDFTKAKMYEYAQAMLEKKQEQITSYMESAAFSDPVRLLDNYIQSIESTKKMLTGTMNGTLNALKAAMEEKAKSMYYLSPKQVLKRGFAMITDIDGGIITSAKKLSERKNARAVFADGDVDIKVTK